VNTLLIATVILACLAVYFVWSTFRQLRRGRVVRAGGAAAGCVTTGSLCAIGAIVAVSYASYGRLTHEQTVGTIQFVAIGDERFEARLMVAGERDRIVTLSGDEWQLDARVVRWKPPATILGLDPIYRLERLSGRYTDVERELSAERTVHALSETRALDVWELANEYPLLLPGVDAYYGTATYLPMANGARYDISMSRDTLLARPANDAARDALGAWTE